MQKTNILNDLENLKFLDDNWDNEGAPKPNQASFKQAEETIIWLLEQQNLIITSIDPDVIGGIGIFVGASGQFSRTAWIAHHNNGVSTLILVDNDNVYHGPWNLETRNNICSFLNKSV